MPSLPIFLFSIYIFSVKAAQNSFGDNFDENNSSNCTGCTSTDDYEYGMVESSGITEDNTLSPSYLDRPPTSPPNLRYGNDWSETTATSVDVLVAALFLIAAGWLVLAIIYSVLILIVVRMRARGELDIYDENFGRLFLLGTRCYIPLGCILRRHVVAMQSRNRGRQSLHIMTREERRRAMELLLADAKSRELEIEKPEEIKPTEKQEEIKSAEGALPEGNESAIGSIENDIHSSDNPVCSICLMEYEENDLIFQSPRCVHRFHQECLMDWLERRNNTDCPCCRETLVSDEDVWDTVQQLRREQRKLRRQENRRNSTLGRLLGFSKIPDASEANHIESAHQDHDIDVAQQEYNNVIASVELSDSTSQDFNTENIEERNSGVSSEQPMEEKEYINEDGRISLSDDDSQGMVYEIFKDCEEPGSELSGMDTSLVSSNVGTGDGEIAKSPSEHNSDNGK
mmetsp:Transcript_34292/g.39040  ORF Transcript_34292/g.39040 Transcript_34292/m.39040 type:complete len:456 (-) Transcript_34292:144-1511(-)|eukprot:CAMPEP_0194131952 /NCGR_PEP_ID=MMETSP0152-20130528/2553_1 /TAXON_ID=1049557 /ORGANISM="Thalassiothrix antarctica, Strain L6-D1" /LENGTH=455 /DNA_ID=CAMNT_0038826851 /DNA_START=125 /DNA_END=1492 /DNA_ORIENTATION=+